MSTTETKVTHTPGRQCGGLDDVNHKFLTSKGAGQNYCYLCGMNLRTGSKPTDMLEALEAARGELMYYHVEAQKKAFVIGQIALKGSALLTVEAAIQKTRGGVPRP